jgi:hypothetical protein
MILLFETDSGNEANRIIAALNDAGIATFLGGQNTHSLGGMLVPNPLGVYLMDGKKMKKAREILNKVLSE